ncbi:hypothetical protein F5148DRAFT_1170637 [Russula earlei]|uniref:Uncharacterized protein n=1 Tax=Russula earlei TaxID=71964 RepID=A0ACC0UI93_9AGAM|nr:hypothetical protein F5148DRAFT_1170637 [Russula earlei]
MPHVLPSPFITFPPFPPTVITPSSSFSFHLAHSSQCYPLAFPTLCPRTATMAQVNCHQCHSPCHPTPCTLLPTSIPCATRLLYHHILPPLALFSHPSDQLSSIVLTPTTHLCTDPDDTCALSSSPHLRAHCPKHVAPTSSLHCLALSDLQ